MSGGASQIGVVDLTLTNDVAGELQITDPRAWNFLELLLQHGGEGRWTWACPEAMREMVADLICAGLLVEREHVTHRLQVTPDYLTIKITDKGRNVLALHQQRKVVAGKVQALE